MDDWLFGRLNDSMSFGKHVVFESLSVLCEAARLVEQSRIGKQPKWSWQKSSCGITVDTECKKKQVWTFVSKQTSGYLKKEQLDNFPPLEKPHRSLYCHFNPFSSVITCTPIILIIWIVILGPNDSPFENLLRIHILSWFVLIHPTVGLLHTRQVFPVLPVIALAEPDISLAVPST